MRVVVIEPLRPEITAPATLQFRAALLDSLGARLTPEANGRLEFTSSTPAAATCAWRASHRCITRATGSSDAVPNEPAARSRYVAPSASAASSMRYTP